jgi:predicted RNA-binding Zn ribbon-like protein
MADAIDTLTPAEDHPKAAPGDLNHIRRFVNTRDLEHLTDEIAEPDTLRDWLAERGLIDERAELTAADVRQAHAVREALRKLLLANNGDPLDPGAIETLNSAAKSAELQVRVGADGIAQLAPVRTGIDAAIGRLLAIVHTAMADGTWPRLKACALHDTCEWAFYDWTKNRSGTWCAMKVCGNRAKARAYRERKRSGAGA